MAKKEWPFVQRIYIVAGNEKEFRRWRCDNVLGPGVEAVYIADEWRLRGIENPIVIFIGTFMLRDDVEAIKQVVAVMTR